MNKEAGNVHILKKNRKIGTRNFSELDLKITVVLEILDSRNIVMEYPLYLRHFIVKRRQGEQFSKLLSCITNALTTQNSI